MSQDEIPAFLEPTPRWLVAARLLTAAALGISSYLLTVSLMQSGPAGCGAGSGCDEVLSSPWARVFGVPVSVPASLAYAALMAALFAVGPNSSPALRRLGWAALPFLAAAVLTAIVWFVGLQIASIKAYCPWCLVDHACGGLAALLVLIEALRSPDVEEEPHVPFPRTAVACLAGMGLSAALILPALQMAFPSAGPAVARLADGRNDDTGPGPGPGPDRQIAVLNGQRRISLKDAPLIGAPEAPKVLVVLFDYCCKHCRLTHQYLERGRERYGDQFAVVALPMPMNANCNRTIDETEPRFEHACEIARLALAVWRADRAQFAKFDQWLFAPEDPRDPTEARQMAESLVTPAALAAALEDPWIDAEIARNVEAYASSGIDRIPVILSPGFAAIIGRPSSEETLFRILEDELGLKQTP